ncbi:MAG: DUF3473 domain-containing protein [Candidatus Electrothrix sp. ATG1]|nr:DUF3473 domain-containing protein [Candidatus Electrothrix sp. ATG1]
MEDLTGKQVAGYRAPSFSITDDILTLVGEAGYLYDSSFNSYEGHGRYGALSLPQNAKQDEPIYKITSSFYEIPVSNLRVGSRIIPWGGGGYFRLLPVFLHRAGVKRILEQKKSYTFYLHPWEIDPGQPRVKEAKAFFRFRHYVNLHKTKQKLKGFIESNNDKLFLRCKDFVIDAAQ